MRVGVFDSGVGGLTVLKKLTEKYPLNDYIYFGDTINIPYGEKDINTLYNLSSKIVEFFIENKVDLIDADKHIKNIKSDTIVLGCTHYPLIKDKINRKCIDMADNIVLESNKGNGSITLYFSKLDDKVIENVNRIINKEIKVYEKVL